MEDNDQQGIFRSRYVEKMKLRKKTRGEADSYLKMKQLLSSATQTLQQCYNVIKREDRKYLTDMYLRIQFE